jgi:predicted TIM-barrel fold metal-dependent hydrolase
MKLAPTVRTLVLLSLLCATSACSSLWNALGGDFAGEPWELEGNVSTGAKQLIAAAFEGLPEGAPVDHHVHLLTPEVHPDWLSPWHPISHGMAMTYMDAAGVELGPELETDYVERLSALMHGFPRELRVFLYAMDHNHDADGVVDAEHTTFHVGNERVVHWARRFPERFEPVMSVHPARPDALAQLDHWASQGVRFLKWIPASQRIDPAHEGYRAFYEKLVDHDITLLCHTGAEAAIDAEHHELGNPLRLRYPLSLGVRVVALHMGTTGREPDTEHPDRPSRRAFDLLLRLLDDPRYEGQLYGEISASVFVNRDAEVLATLLKRQDLHPRLLNGSDYPLCAVNVLVQTDRLADDGFLTEAQAAQLEEIYKYNPLLFDFVLKRTLVHPETGQGFAASVFGSPFQGATR